MSTRFTILPLVWLLSTAAFGIELSDLEIRDRVVSAEVSVGHLDVDVTIEIDRAVGLSASSLGLTARRVASAPLYERLPEGVKALPVVLSVDPPATGALSFAGTYTLELRTRQLSYEAGGGLRLFRAEPGGAFEDATQTMGGNNFWIRGEGHGAAEWLLVADPRPAIAVAGRKLDRLESLLADNGREIHEALHAELWTLLGATRAAWERGTPRDAIAELEELDDLVVARGGGELPNVWRSTGDLANVAGELSSAARSLRFSLVLAGVNAPTNPRAAH